MCVYDRLSLGHVRLEPGRAATAAKVQRRHAHAAVTDVQSPQHRPECRPRSVRLRLPDGRVGRGNDSEYVGDESEFADDNDDEDVDVEGPSDVDEPNADYPPAASASLNFQQILAMRDQLGRGTDEWTNSSGLRPRGVGRRRRHRGPASAAYSVNPAPAAAHPNDYLPKYNISLSGSTDQSLADDDADGGGGANINDNFNSADFICREGDDDVIHYGFPPSASLLRPRDRRRSAADDDDDDAMDSISVSLPGTASELDLLGVCEIEDSEANASDLDLDDAVAELRPLDAPSAH